MNVDLGQSFSHVRQYDPVTSATAIASNDDVQTLTVAVPALILEIVP